MGVADMKKCFFSFFHVSCCIWAARCLGVWDRAVHMYYSVTGDELRMTNSLISIVLCIESRYTLEIHT
jgi:hypothetical protein